MRERADRPGLRERLALYLVMGSVNCKGDPEEVLGEAIEAGITLFQYREKGSGARQGAERLVLGRKLRKLCGDRGMPFIVNDDVDLAIALDADGVHVGQEDEQAAVVRRRIGNRWLGVSAHDPAEALQAISQGADYLGAGPMYATATKSDARAVQGPGLIRMLREAGIEAPLIGIGGIASGRAAPVIEAGADGIAVISAIAQASIPREAVRQLLAEIAHARLS